MKSAAAEKKEQVTRSAQAAEEAGVSPNTLRLLSAAPQVMENVLGGMLGLELHPPSTRISIPAGRGITASSQLRGAWEGVISIHCEKDLAAEIACKFFGARTGGLVAENIADALTEVTSMVVGNLKGALPGLCSHTIPALRDPSDLAFASAGGPGTRKITFPTGDGALTLSLISTDRPSQAA